jgi:parallel beta-helix repeat protein
MKKVLLFLILIVVLKACTGLADTHYVSKTGSDVYPYTSWETATDSIQEGINAASYGDTVRVGEGTYRQPWDLIIAPGIALIGAGMDACIINGGRGSQLNPYTIIHGADSSTIEGFHVKGAYSVNSVHCTGIYSSSYGGGALKKITNNKITDCSDGIRLGGSNLNTEVSNNIFSDVRCGINGGPGLIINNTIIAQSYGIWLVDKGPTIIKNLITASSGGSYGIYADFGDSIFVENNLIVGYERAVSLTSFSGQFITAPVRNNTLTADNLHTVVHICGFSNEIKNNIISAGYYGIAASEVVIYFTGLPVYIYYSHPQVAYNDLWGNVISYLVGSGCSIDTSLGENIYLDPMFVGGDDYHLQYGSPCIDAGDPNIKDPDSSRSDIGFYGGRWGETHTYQDYPPKAPDSLTATSSDTLIILSWKSNTESDLSHYLVYKDTIEGFIPDTFKIVGEVPKDSSNFWDYDVILGGDYYRVSAWDLTGNESDYSEELPVWTTDLGDFTEEESPPMPRMYQLRQNYPNPFNPRTTIVYHLPDVGYQPAEVEIVIYNLLGQKVRTLVKERKYPGEHRVTWDGKDDEGNDLSSSIYFYKLTFSGVDLYPLVKPKKMVLLR